MTQQWCRSGLTGGRIAASPMSYSVDGKQYVAVSAGNVLYSFALPDSPK